MGKTTFCSSLAQYIDAETISSSDIIKKQIILNDNKSVKNIENNQNALIDGIRNLKIYSRYLLLDGHFCLLDSDYNIKLVPKIIFYTLNPISIILLECNPEQIYERLLKRDGQDCWDISLINKMQSQEHARAYQIAEDLDMSILTFDTEKYPSKEAIRDLIKTLDVKIKQ